MCRVAIRQFFPLLLDCGTRDYVPLGNVLAVLWTHWHYSFIIVRAEELYRIALIGSQCQPIL